MPFSLPANYQPGDQYSNVAANNVAAAINAIVNNLAQAYVATNEGLTNTTTYTDLPTTSDQVTVTIGQSGVAIVFISAQISVSSTSGMGDMAFAMSGANTLAAGDQYAIGYQAWTASATAFLGSPFLLPGLTPGSTTFKLKYRNYASGYTSNFSSRRIAVIPFP
jgi:hypothetical protein